MGWMTLFPLDGRSPPEQVLGQDVVVTAAPWDQWSHVGEFVHYTLALLCCWSSGDWGAVLDFLDEPSHGDDGPGSLLLVQLRAL